MHVFSAPRATALDDTSHSLPRPLPRPRPRIQDGRSTSWCGR
jgi:hypothetical protein